MSAMFSVIGWDLGGANLKLARIEGRRAVAAAQVPCPLRQDASKFDAALAEALPLCPTGAVHAITMTGELSDVFRDRADGVAYLVQMMRQVADGEAVFYGGRAGFLRDTGAIAHVERRGVGQLACEREPDRPVSSRGVAHRCRHHDHRPRSGQGRRGRGERLYRRREARRGRARLYRGRAHAGDGGCAERAVQRAHARRRRRTLCHHGRCLASLGALPAGADPYPTPDLKGKSTQESAMQARPHARPRRGTLRTCWPMSMSRAISPSVSAARSRRRRRRSLPARDWRPTLRLSAPAAAASSPARLRRG